MMGVPPLGGTPGNHTLALYGDYIMYSMATI